jgi:tetratricopeptide (TPR) repeat protein
LSSSRTSKPNGTLQELLQQAREVRARKQRAAATKLFRSVVAAYPHSAIAWYELAMTLDGRGLEAEAVPLYRKALRMGLPRRISRLAWTWLGSSLRKTARPQAALRCFAQARAEGNTEAYVDAFEGHALLSLGRYARASAAFERAIGKGGEQQNWRWHQRRAAAQAQKANGPARGRSRP